MIIIIKALLLGLVLSASTYGPYNATVVSVYDGDTFTAYVDNWPGDHQKTKVRIRGIDAPELRTKHLCEKALAKKSKAYLDLILPDTVKISGIKQGKYFGRVIADVYIDGKSVADMMINRGYARGYQGGKRMGWCQ